MNDRPLHVVTGAFGYSGRRIAQRLLARGLRVRTLTGAPPSASPFGERVDVRPLNFERPEALRESLRGAGVLYNTYWVRFNHRAFTHAQAVTNTLRLFAAAKDAGVERVVHVSITNPAENSPFEYFRGKAKLERALIESGLSHAILRPAVLFGGGDILINNIAWMLRRLPLFGVFGDGAYRLRPLHVDDFADLAVAAGERRADEIIDAVGPETFTYRELVKCIAARIGCRRPIVSVSPQFGLAVATLMGWIVRDVVLTREEIAGLMADLLYTDAPAAGPTRLSDWVSSCAHELGRCYASELGRRRR